VHGIEPDIDFPFGVPHQVHPAHPGNVLDPPLDSLVDQGGEVSGVEDVGAHCQ